MKTDARWIMTLLNRILTNAIVGGFNAAVVGAFCIGAVGILIDSLVPIPPWAKSTEDWIFMQNTVYGVIAGAGSGFLMGALIFAIATIRRRSDGWFIPFFFRVAAGQFLGALNAVLFYLSLTFVVSHWRAETFETTAQSNFSLLAWGAPILMICGAIAGALTKRD